jgi:hypothetical protein
MPLVTQEPKIDVVKRERQWHANPAHAWRELHGFAWFGQGVCKGILQLMLERVHVLLSPSLTVCSYHHNLR